MSRGNSLPFPRGDTFFGGDANLISASLGVNLEGKEYEVNDINGSGETQVLRVVRNKHASHRMQAMYGYRFGVTAGWNGKKIRGKTAAHGDLAFPLDQAYTTTVAPNDLCYVVTEGPTRCKTSSATSAGTALTQFDYVSWGRAGTGSVNGCLIPGAAGRFNLGQIDSTVAATTATFSAIVHIGGGFADTE